MVLRKTTCTTPLTNIDVPFHSSFLRSGVPAFRQMLYSKLSMDSMMPERLVGRYVPNLTARPLSLGREYVRHVFEITGSPVLGHLLGEGEEGWW